MIDLPCQTAGVVPGHQFLCRDLDEVWISKIARPVGISPAHGLGSDVNCLGGVVAVIADGKVLKDVDFGSVLEASLHGSEGMRKLRPETTAPGHMSGGADLQNPKEKAQKITYEIAPDGNAVIIEEQMIRANQDAMDHALMTRIMTKNVGMIRAAVGSSGN